MLAAVSYQAVQGVSVLRNAGISADLHGLLTATGLKALGYFSV